MLRLLLLVIGLPLMFQPAAAAPSKEIEAKVALEGSLEKRLQAVLREALGSNDLIVIVNVSMLAESEKSEAEIMPGVPANQSPAIGGALGLTLPTVSRILATIIVDQSTSEPDIELIQKVAKGLLGISPERGDGVSIEKIKFHKPSAAAPDPWRHSSLGLSLLWLIFAVIALVLLQNRFLRPLLDNLRDNASLARGAGQRSDPGAQSEAPAKEAPAPADTALPEANGPSRPNLPFSFIHEGDLPKLNFMMRSADARSAAILIHYLPPALASRTLACLEPAVQREVAGLMSKVVELDENQVRPFEESVRKRIDYLMGGEDKLAALLNGLPSNAKNDLFQTLRDKDPELAVRLARRIVFIEDLAGLEPGELGILTRRLPIRTLACVLKSSEILKNSILPKLPQGMKEWLVQEIELYPEIFPEALEAAQQRVLEVFAQGIREGRFTRKEAAAEIEADRPPFMSNGA